MDISLVTVSAADCPSCELDGGLVDGCRRKLEAAGYFYLTDVPDGFDYEAFISRFGEITSQYDGVRIWELTPEAGMDDVYHSKNTRPLVPHTECYEFPGAPPRFLALWCLQPAAGPGGETTLVDGYEFLAQLSEKELEQLIGRKCRFTSTEGLRRQGIDLAATQPLVELRGDGKPIIRFSYNNIVDEDNDRLLREFLERVNTFFDAHHIAVRLERNALLMWDNHRMIHSRTGFTDPRRHLRRALLTDSEQSRETGS